MLTQKEDPRRAGADLGGRDGHRVLLRRGDRVRLADSPQDRQVNNLQFIEIFMQTSVVQCTVHTYVVAS